MFNNVSIGGRLARDPDYRIINGPNGQTEVCNMTVVTDSYHQGRDAAGQTVPQFFRVTTWRNSAKACAEHLKKGSMVIVNGSVVLTRSQSATTGQTYANLEILNPEVTFIGGPANAQPGTTSAQPVANAAPATPAQPVTVPNYDNVVTAAMPMDNVYVEDDDLPF